MLRAHRAWHRRTWLVLGPLTLVGLALALASVTPRPAETPSEPAVVAQVRAQTTAPATTAPAATTETRP